MNPSLSFVIPMYNCASTIAALVQDIDNLRIDGGHEIVLVDDGSSDTTIEVCRELVRTADVHITLVQHSRNFGEHNAVLTGWRYASGTHIVNLDDDGQNPPDEAVRLWRHAMTADLDVVFGQYEVKQHSAWRNVGSWFTSRMTDASGKGDVTMDSERCQVARPPTSTRFASIPHAFHRQRYALVDIRIPRVGDGWSRDAECE